MQHISNTDSNTQLDGKSSDHTAKSGDQPVIDSLWPVNYQKTYNVNLSFDGNTETQIQKKPFGQQELSIFETTSSTQPSKDETLAKDEKFEPVISNVSSAQSHCQGSSLSKFNYDSISKLVVSPVSIQNWCSYNLSPIASPTCGFGYRPKPPANVDGNNSTGDRFLIWHFWQGSYNIGNS